MSKISLRFVVNSFHKVAKIYSLLEFSMDGNPSEWLLALHGDKRRRGDSL